ncbi:MAG: Vms1/Ankzf1 family peptidyl-tRNA hydrolase [Dehalococcoidales bacterium]|jgi:hypothetical protein
MLKKRMISRGGALELLERIAGAPAAPSRTLYIPPFLAADELAVMLGEIQAAPETSGELGEIATASPTGAVIFRSDAIKYLIVPPFPVAEKVLAAGIDTAPLRAQLAKDYCIGVVLVRLGAYAIGICQGDKIIGSKVGTGLVHGRNRKGGSSSHRFERHRDKQIEQFLIRVCGHAREQLEPYLKALDYMVYGGAKKTILMAQKYCPLLMKLDKPVLPPLLDIPDPRQAVLESAVARVWSSAVWEW